MIEIKQNKPEDKVKRWLYDKNVYVKEVKDALWKVSTLVNREEYSYTQEDINELFEEIQEAVNKTKSIMNGR